MKNRKLLLIPVVLLVAALVGWLLLRDNDTEGRIEASGTIEGTEADLGFQLGGRVAQVNGREGDRVAAATILARLDQDELEARKSAAVAQAEAARALLLEFEHGARPEELRQAQSSVTAAQSRLEESQAVLTRTRRLYEGGAVSKEDLDRAETAHTVARTQYQQAREQFTLVDRGPRAERIAAQRAAVRQAEAAIAQTQAALDNAVILAPFPGVVTVRHREPGEAVGPGAPVITLLNTNDRWVRIYVREDQVGRVGIGRRAAITSDSHPGKTFNGRVTFIASEAEFTPRNVQTDEERVKLVYAVKVAIVGDDALQLKPGVPADVVIDTDEQD
ncbi:MAG TPA: HlyD family efflux transporter periplasmic adaptor subunit [Longimicrobiales bacterium]|nr:HlyD family efflux transporter periplasmic adaptor subunit [Longimicrobiales bacterium]